MKVKVANLSMSYPIAGGRLEIFKDVNIQLNNSSTMTIIGSSGVGKSTLLNILGGLEFADSGEVEIGEYKITNLGNNSELTKFRGNKIGFIFQFHNLLPEFSALENVSMPLIISGKKLKDANEVSRNVLEKVGLLHRINHRPGTLSGGEQQRVAIARAIVTKPELILCDEPTGNLDPKTGEKVTDLLLNVREELQATLILVTHSNEIANRISNIYELKNNGLFKQ